MLPLLSMTKPMLRYVFTLENRELLLDFVFENAEIILLEAVREAPTIVDHRGVQHHQVDVHANLGILTRARLTGRRRRRARNRRNLRQGNSDTEKKR